MKTGAPHVSSKLENPMENLHHRNENSLLYCSEDFQRRNNIELMKKVYKTFYLHVGSIIFFALFR